ncbi:hypothetical protein RPHASCH2410_CH16645 [Rhizobium phaseoli Ch24-10]|nr:hypothetical protein RPHASCH2410_CH16645 [Rhizobium phaseoli Ch24-10]
MLALFRASGGDNQQRNADDETGQNRVRGEAHQTQAPRTFSTPIICHSSISLGQGSSPGKTGFNSNDAICLCKAG